MRVNYFIGFVIAVFALIGNASAEEGASAVKYEVTMDAKTAKVNKDFVSRTEGADVYKLSECTSKVKGKGAVVFTCQKPTGDTDALFRSAVNLGATVKVTAASSAKPKALKSAADCPAGCFWSTRCDPTGACCKVPQPWVKC